MTNDLPPTFQDPNWQTIQPRELITTGPSNALQSIVHQQNRIGSTATRVNAAVMCCTEVPLGGALGINKDTWLDVAHGHIRLPQYWRRVRLVTMGRDVQLRLNVIGPGVIVTNTHGSSVGWETSSSTSISSPTLDAAGLIRFTVQVLQTESGTLPQVLVVGVYEVPITDTADLPTLLNAITAGVPWIGVAENPIDSSNLPYDVWLVQTFANNVRGLRQLRTRGMCHMYPNLRPHIIGSVYWRADGPYSIAVQPWAESITVALTLRVAVASIEVEVFAMTSRERFDTAKSRRQTVSGSLGDVVRLVFQGLPCKSGYGDQEQVWVCYRSKVADSAHAFQVVFGIFGTVDDGFVAKNDFEAPSSDSAEQFGPVPVGWAWRAAYYTWDEYLSAADKGNMDFGTAPTGTVDGAAVLGTYTPPDSTYELADQIPSPPIKAAQVGGGWGSIYQFAPESNGIAWHRAGALRLLGVYVEVRYTPSAALQKTPLPRTLPKASKMQGVAIDTTDLGRFSVSQLALRHWGNRNQRPLQSGVRFDGNWIVLSSSNTTSKTVTVDFPLLRDPNFGADGAGLCSRKMRARVTWCALRTHNLLDDDITCRFWITVEGDHDPKNELDVVVTDGSALPQSVTAAEVGVVARRGSGAYIDSGTYMYTHGQQVSWGRDVGMGSDGALPWRTDEIQWSKTEGVELAPVVGITFPTLIAVHCRVVSLNASMIIAGIEVWLDSRE